MARTTQILGLVGLSQALINLRVLTPEISDEIGETLVYMIRTRTRLGFGVDKNGGAKQKFKPLRPSTITHRQYLKSRGLLSPLATPAKATMTRFGDMMDDLTYDKAPQRVTILFSQTREALKAYYNSQLGRPFMFLTDKETKAARNLVQQAIDAYVDSLAASV
jgi:hypothetical protein